MKTEDLLEEQSNNNTNDFDDNYQPCWYAEYSKETLEWKVGVKSKIKNDEYLVSITSIKNYQNQLDKIKSLEFGVSLLELYKKGGKKAVKNWISKELLNE